MSICPEMNIFWKLGITHFNFEKQNQANLVVFIKKIRIFKFGKKIAQFSENLPINWFVKSGVLERR
ncbi:MAG: hypothetical protein B6244_10390 [Candidatus Cloacimonetes bacterium 4572_55]|nr:MAG: hypothetical protein B6244_10390 [Candidatus Cloacimonetes bacterium 4572_55]